MTRQKIDKIKMLKFYFIDLNNGYRILTNVKSKSVEVGYFIRTPLSHQEKPKNKWKKIQRDYTHILEQANSFVKDNIDFMAFKSSNNIELSEQEIKCLHLLLKMKQCEDVLNILDPMFIETSGLNKYISNVKESREQAYSKYISYVRQLALETNEYKITLLNNKINELDSLVSNLGDFIHFA